MLPSAATGCMMKVPVPRSARLPMPEKLPDRFVTVPWLTPVRFHVALVAFNVPVPVSLKLPKPDQK